MKTIKYIFLLCLLALQSAGALVAQNTLQQPVDLGNKAFSFSYTDTKNTANYTNDYWGQPSNDVFYKFTLTRAMDISIDHCGSELFDTYLHVLDSTGQEIFANDDDWEYQYCSNFYNSYLYLSNLPAGTYYVVSEGYWEDGNIATTINGICPLPATGLYDGSAVTGTANVGTNYILTITPTVATSDVSGLGVNESLQTVQYFDGLGRSIQTVQRGITPTKQDLATLTEYDGAGREQFQWLPKSHNGSGAFVEPTVFKGITQTEYGGDSRPYNEAIIEPSPLNRVLGNKGPGAAWENNPTTIAYDANTATDAVAYFYVNASNNLVRGANYAQGSLYKTVSKDEDGKTVEEYKDKLGQVVLKRSKNGGESENVDTYFVNNDLGQLAYVIPPKAADVQKNNTIGDPIFDSNDNLKKFGYLYKYDERGNCIYKRLPGCTPIYMVYDKADRLVLSQDGNQRIKPTREWTATKYDVFGRVIYMGTMSRTETDSTTNYKSIRDIFVTELVVDGYTANNFDSCTPLTENFYDNYSFLTPQSTLNFVSELGFDAQHTSAKGMQTGSRVYVLGNQNQLTTTVMYYDYRGRVVQTRSSNHLGGLDLLYNHYTFSGQVLQSMKKHTATGQAEITELYTNTYDHAGRLLTTYYKINTKDPVLLVNNTYDELGRLIQKKRHNDTDLEEFDYNIRNWSTRLKSGGFEEKLYYNTNPVGTTACYNGNISYSTWTYNNAIKGYAYSYDQLNRLTTSMYAENHIITDDFYYYMEWFNYDKMGNIIQLTRNGSDDTNDQLYLTYNGNQLKNVWDDYGSRNQYNVKEYQDKASNDSEMDYDVNGNLTKDLDRDIVTIKYNLLNLPEIIQFKNGNQIRNTYDASGQKLKTLYSTLGTPVVIPVNTIGNLGDPNNCNDYLNGIDYIGNIEYFFSNDCGDYQFDLAKIYNSEGYVDNFYYTIFNYYRRDHLGNNREVWRAPWSYGTTNVAASTIQRTQYYPSGLPWASNSGDNPWTQNKKYNGKEFVEMHGYDTYDIVWRQYYPAIGRFQTPDPEVEQFYDLSPYSMCGNNMVMNVDPDGRVIETAWDVYSLATGVASFAKNVATGNVAGAIIDGVGIVADAAAVLTPGVPGGAGAAIKAVRVGDKVADAVKTGKTAEKVVEGGRAGKTIAKENGVKVKSYGTNDAHKPAHAHVKGGGKEVRVGPNGKPLKGQPELSDKQKKVIENNRKEIRKEVNAVGKENKKIEDQNQRR